MLGIEKDPKMLKIRQDNPLNKIKVPNCSVDDIDERIGQFYIPIDLNGETMHPLLMT